ncbi:hypothetical protein HPB48_013791 [Haemaphysalis longicornis]|uniref:Uncharacterized protein n=1 Tax=Haemaphysalis longicornis TaxID=44386 RepID=A0A9J6GZN9_HAELO|nr:hypothetical protein HPB48_013791 [Haemaphysalis longicornis]
MIDESSDIPVTKFLGISIIHRSAIESMIVTTFLSLCTLEVCTGDEIVVAINFTLVQYCLKLERRRGIGTDNASLMSGINNQVHRKLEAAAAHADTDPLRPPIFAASHIGCYGGSIAQKFGIPNKQNVQQVRKFLCPANSVQEAVLSNE